MIEAVNAVISNATLLRNNAEQVAALRATPADTGAARQEMGTPVAPYISPYIFINNQYNKAVLQIRDSDTGDVLREFPSETALEARARAESLEQQSLSRPSRTTLAEEREASVQTAPSNARPGGIQLDSSSFNVIQFSSADIAAPAASSAPSAPQPRVAEAQIASAALSAGALSGQSLSAGVSVTA